MVRCASHTHLTGLPSGAVQIGGHSGSGSAALDLTCTEHFSAEEPAAVPDTPRSTSGNRSPFAGSVHVRPCPFRVARVSSGSTAPPPLLPTTYPAVVGLALAHPPPSSGLAADQNQTVEQWRLAGHMEWALMAGGSGGLAGAASDPNLFVQPPSPRASPVSELVAQAED